MKKTLTSLILCAALMFGVGCSTTWLTTFEGYLKIAGPILIQILEIVSLARGVPVSATLVAKINSDEAAVTSLANSINAASAANLPTTCAAFNQAVSTFAGDLSSIEALANIGPNTSGEIAAAVGIAQAAIQEIQTPISACQGSSTPAMARAVLQSAALHVTSPDDVVRRFNAVTDSKHHVHLHSKLTRVMTFGRAQ
jgi:hypothetical protein